MAATALFFALPARADVCEVIRSASSAVVKLYGAAAGREHGYGTGVIVSPDGKILTTLSLLVSGSSVRVVLADGRRFEARLDRIDEARQLALLRIDARDLPHLVTSATPELQAGDMVFALGNCFKIADGKEPVSICRGILSLKLPNLQARRLSQDFEYNGPALVFDAITANPGAAGGPLLDSHGRFIGLVGKTVEATTTNTRLNYAIPSEVLADFLGEKPTSKTVTGNPASRPADSSKKPYLGIKLSELGFQHVSAFVERVRSESPAAKAGVRPDDLIVAIDTTRITDADSYRKTVETLLPGQVIQLTVKRGPDVILLSVTVGETP